MVKGIKRDYIPRTSISRSTNVAHDVKYVANGLCEEATKKEGHPTNALSPFLVQFLFQYWVEAHKGSRHTIYDILGSNQCETQNKTTNGCETQPCKNNTIHSIPPDTNNITCEITSPSYRYSVAICRMSGRTGWSGGCGKK